MVNLFDQVLDRQLLLLSLILLLRGRPRLLTLLYFSENVDEVRFLENLLNVLVYVHFLFLDLVEGCDELLQLFLEVVVLF